MQEQVLNDTLRRVFGAALFRQMTKSIVPNIWNRHLAETIGYAHFQEALGFYAGSSANGSAFELSEIRLEYIVAEDQITSFSR